jgi:hypothetical protein
MDRLLNPILGGTWTIVVVVVIKNRGRANVHAPAD